MEWIKNNLAIVSVLLITLGIVRLTAYYSYFGISISSYLDLTEVIQLQFNYFAIIACVIIFANAITVMEFGFVLENDDEDIYKELYKTKKYQQNKALSTINDYFNTATKSTVIVLCFINVLTFIYKAITKHFFYYPCIEYIVIILVLHVFIKNSLRYSKILQSFNLPEKKVQSNIAIGVAIVISLALTFEYSRSEAFNLIIKRSENEVTLNFESKIISTNDSLVFVGKTKNYVFIYNRFTGQSEIYPFSEIKSIQYRTGKDYAVIPHRYRIK